MMGTTANIRWAERGEKERIWVCNPGHPIAEGLGEYFEIDMTEMYGEPFQVPAPDETVFVSWFEGGEVFRSGLCYKRGRIWYVRKVRGGTTIIMVLRVHWRTSYPRGP